MIEHEQHGEVALMRLAHGKVNALDLELLEAITAAFTSLDEDVRAVVLTGASGAFSAGVDLARILDGGAEYVESYLPALSRAFLTVFDCKLPVVAAVNGHAIAGGCIFVCACDRRLMAEGDGLVGVTELSVGVPFPTSAMEILRFAVGSARLNDLVTGAHTVLPDDALRLGLVDQVVPPDALIDRAVAEARRLAAIPAASFRLTKLQLRREAQYRISDHALNDDPEVVRLWASDEGQAAIRAFMDRLASGS